MGKLALEQPPSLPTAQMHGVPALPVEAAEEELSEPINPVFLAPTQEEPLAQKEFQQLQVSTIAPHSVKAVSPVLPINRFNSKLLPLESLAPLITLILVERQPPPAPLIQFLQQAPEVMVREAPSAALLHGYTLFSSARC